eukprot:415186-Rhodomonas_salina.1
MTHDDDDSSSRAPPGAPQARGFIRFRRCRLCSPHWHVTAPRPSARDSGSATASEKAASGCLASGDDFKLDHHHDLH